MSGPEISGGSEVVRPTPSARQDPRSEALAVLAGQLMTRTTAKGKDEVIDNAENLGLILRLHPDVRDRFAYNLFEGKEYLMAPIPTVCRLM